MRSLVLLLLLLACPAPAASPAPTPTETPEGVGAGVARDLAAGRFAAVVARARPELAAALPPERIERVWKGLVAQAGALVDTGAPRATAQGNLTLVRVPLRFERASVDLKITVTADRKIGGLFFAPAEQDAAAWNAPPYAPASAVREESVTVGTGPLALPGTLALPAGISGRLPAVVLVHGSGPHDRNEQIGPNRPFQDLAWGLAARGIAVLRYEKRTKAHPEAFATLARGTVREEVMDDARAAVALLRARKEVDPARVVLAGHSLGGTLAPRIAREEPGIAAVVILAGATRPLPDLMVEQAEYLASVDSSLDAATRTRFAALKDEAARARAARDGDAPVLGAPASYWADLNAYDAAATARALTIPVLILAGGRDYQVTAKDLARFREALAGKANVTIREFPALNHLFVAGEGRSTPAEYDRAGHVDVQVVDAIAGFVKSVRPAGAP